MMIRAIILLLLTVFSSAFADSTEVLFSGPPHLAHGKLAPGWEQRIDYAAESNLRLFWIASSGEPKWSAIRKNADSTLVARAESALPFLISKLSVDDARQSLTINQILKKIGKPALPALFHTLDTTTNRDAKAMALLTIGDIGDTSSISGLIRFSYDNDIRLKSTALRALASIPKLSPTAIARLQSVSNDTIAGIRRYALRALILNHHIESIPTILQHLTDTSFPVRETIRSAVLSVATTNDSTQKMSAKRFVVALRDSLEQRLKPVQFDFNYPEFQSGFGLTSATAKLTSPHLNENNTALFTWLQCYRILQGDSKSIWKRAAKSHDPLLRAESVYATRTQDQPKLNQLPGYLKHLSNDADPIVAAAIRECLNNTVGANP